jgi:hypothetical protein
LSAQKSRAAIERSKKEAARRLSAAKKKQRGD